jgi:hypothetical protein
MALNVSSKYTSATDDNPLHEYFRSPVMGNRPIARPLPTQCNTSIEKKHTNSLTGIGTYNSTTRAKTLPLVDHGATVSVVIKLVFI